MEPMGEMLEMLKAMAGSDVPPAPVAETVGFRLVDVGEGEATIEIAAGERHHNPMGTVHGGILCDVADAAMGTAWASTMDADETFTTLEMDAKFLRAVTEDTLRAEAEVVKRGSTTGLVECCVRSSDGDLVARVQSTVMALDPDRGPADAPGAR